MKDKKYFLFVSFVIIIFLVTMPVVDSTLVSNEIQMMSLSDNNTISLDIPTPFFESSNLKNSDNHNPLARITWEPVYPEVGDTVEFDASSSYDPDGEINTYEWDFDYDGKYDDGTGQIITKTWNTEGIFGVSLKVTDEDGSTDTDVVSIYVGCYNKIPHPIFDYYPKEIHDGDILHLDGSDSYDPNGHITEYHWVIMDGMNGENTIAKSGRSVEFLIEGFNSIILIFWVNDNEGYMDHVREIFPVYGGGSSDDEVSPPNWVVGQDMWYYELSDFEFSVSDIASFKSKIDDLYLEVTEVDSNDYNLYFEGDLPTGSESEISLTIPDTEINLPDAHLYPKNNVPPNIKGNIKLRKSDLSFKEASLIFSGKIGYSYLKLPIDLDVEIKSSYDTYYDFLDFADKISIGEIWGVDYGLFEVDIDLQVGLIQDSNSFYISFDEHDVQCVEKDQIDGVDAFRIKRLDDTAEYWYSPDEKNFVDISIDMVLDGWIDVLVDGELKGCPPYRPRKPEGKKIVKPGDTYIYTTYTNDQNSDLVCYGWDWNGDKIVDEWTRNYISGDICRITHTWKKEEINNGKITVYVKAKDTNGEESPWSEPLQNPKAKSILNQIFIPSKMAKLIKFLTELFPNLT